jgi:hypothetical protein
MGKGRLTVLGFEASMRMAFAFARDFCCQISFYMDSRGYGTQKAGLSTSDPEVIHSILFERKTVVNDQMARINLTSK